MMAVDSNSFRTYNYKGEIPQILSLYQEYFTKNKNRIVKELSGAKSRENVDSQAEKIKADIIRKHNAANFKTQVKITSYNRTRKIVDLYFQHIVAMAREFDAVRCDLIPLLRLPLDSQIFGHPCLFSREELHQARVGRKDTYGKLEEEPGYRFLQDALVRKAEQIDETFYPLYFDLLWEGKGSGPRYRSLGRNLFETNFG